MKRNRFSVSLCIASLALVGCSSASTTSISDALDASSDEASSFVSTRKGYVSAKGNLLYDGDGKPLLLQGTNIGGLFFQERWMSLTDGVDTLTTFNTLTTRFSKEDAWDLFDEYQDNFFTTEDFDNLQRLGINCIRLPISYMDVYDCDFQLLKKDDPTAEEILSMKMSLRKSHLEKIDGLINSAESHGMYVVLDLHGAFGSQNGNDHSLDARSRDWLWKQDELGDAYRELTLEVWELLAERYKDYKNIAGYDILNEPAGDNGDPEGITYVTTKIQWDYFNRLYKAIRKIDPNHIVIMESCWGAENMPRPEEYGWQNVVYEFHHYESEWGDESQLISFQRRIDNIVSANLNIPLYMGEFCVHASYEIWKTVIEEFQANDISWTSWTYKVKGESEWGLYLIRIQNEEGENLPISETPHISRGNDSFDEILRKWGKAQRAGVHQNEALCSVFTECLKTPYAPKTSSN